MLPPDDRPLSLPHLPKARVTTVAISETAGESINKLTQLGIRCIRIPVHPQLPDGINSHADLQMFHMELSDIFADEHLFGALQEQSFHVKQISERLGKEYPADVRFNAFRLGNRLICNPNTISQSILEDARKRHLELIPVKQGYAKCGACCLNNNVIITDDPGISQSAQFFCDDHLFISKGSIRLSGYEYGFIGGCCGMIDRDLIAWNGRIETHSDAEKILAFLKKHQIRSINLNNGPLTDIGGILPLKEKAKTDHSYNSIRYNNKKKPNQ